MIILLIKQKNKTTTTTPQALIAIDGSFLTIFSIFSFILSKFLKNFGRNERRRSVQGKIVAYIVFFFFKTLKTDP